MQAERVHLPLEYPRSAAALQEVRQDRDHGHVVGRDGRRAREVLSVADVGDGDQAHPVGMRVVIVEGRLHEPPQPLLGRGGAEGRFDLPHRRVEISLTLAPLKSFSAKLALAASRIMRRVRSAS